MLKKSRGEGGKGVPDVSSGLGDLAVKACLGKVEGKRTEALTKFRVGINFAKIRVTTRNADGLTCCSCVSFSALVTRLRDVNHAPLHRLDSARDIVLHMVLTLSQNALLQFV